MIRNPVLNGKVSRGAFFGEDGALQEVEATYQNLLLSDSEEPMSEETFRQTVEAAFTYFLAANQCRFAEGRPFAAWKLRRRAAWIIRVLLKEQPRELWSAVSLEIGARILYSTTRGTHDAHRLAREGLARLKHGRVYMPHVEGFLRLTLISYLRRHQEIQRHRVAKELAKVALLARAASKLNPEQAARLFRKLGECYLALLGRGAQRKAQRHFKAAELLALAAGVSRELRMLKVA